MRPSSAGSPGLCPAAPARPRVGSRRSTARLAAALAGWLVPALTCIACGTSQEQSCPQAAPCDAAASCPGPADGGAADAGTRDLAPAADLAPGGDATPDPDAGPPPDQGLTQDSGGPPDGGAPPHDAARPPADAMADAGADQGTPDASLDGGPAEFVPPTSWTVRVSPEAPEAVQLAASDVAGYLERMGLTAATVETIQPGRCAAGEGTVLLAGDGLQTEEPPAAQPPAGDSTDQTWWFEERRCPGGSLIVLGGGGLLGRQYAAYEWLHLLGVRFFHPEQEYVPAAPRWPAEPALRVHTPAFRWRGVSLHLAHPLELGDPLRLDREEFDDEIRRYIDWQLKNGASYGRAGGPRGELVGYGLRRGLPRTTGLSLYNQQQGGGGLLDPNEDDWQPILEQAMDQAMGGRDSDPQTRPRFFGFTFNPTEFSEVDDRKVVEQLQFMAQHMATHYPGTILNTINHGTHGEPTPHYGVRYYDLPRFAPENLAVKCHTLMFYDLFRPAPVYGNESFDFMFDFMVDEYQRRELWHYPESAWWLTFDMQIPLYLPITIEARDRDIQGIAFMLEGKLTGHYTFGSGHEWGYWQNEYCALRMAADLGYRYTDCLADITSPLGAAAPEVQAVLLRLIELQERDFVFGDILRYLVGTDAETEAAHSLGIVFHPLPPSPREIMRWGQAELDEFESRIEPALRRMEQDHASLTGRLAWAEARVPADGRPWFEEIRDGVEANELRARHQWLVYGALVRFRRARLAHDQQGLQQAAALLERAEAATEAVKVVTRRRSQGYRYRPIERAIGGGPGSDGDANWTGYPYRYLNRAHHAFYYTRIDRLAREAMADASGQPVVVRDALLAPGEALVVEVRDPVLADVQTDLGDGSAAQPGLRVEHTYAEPGLYPLAVQGSRDGEPFSWEAQVAALAVEAQAGFSGVVEQPAGVQIIESVLPNLVVGRVDEQIAALGFSTGAHGRIDAARWSSLELAADSEAGPAAEALDGLSTAPQRLVVPIVQRSDETVLATLLVDDGRLLLPAGTAQAVLEGMLSVDAVVDAVVLVGGGAFDEQGARRLVATFLGYPADELPAAVPFRLRWTLPRP